MENIIVHVRQDQPPKSVSVVPADMEIDWTYANGLVSIKVPRVEVHRVLVVD